MDDAVYYENPVLVEARDALVKVIHAGYSIWDIEEIAQDALEEAVKETLIDASKRKKDWTNKTKIK